VSVNLNKPELWKTDIARSVDMYNDWFMKFAPVAFRETRIKATADVETTLHRTQNLTNVKVSLLRQHPGVLPTLRMSTCPPIAVDRLVGLAGISKNLVGCMEEGALPPRMLAPTLERDLERIGSIIERMADPDIFVWLEGKRPATDAEVHRAATIVADRLCGAVANPIIRNAQEKRQLAAIGAWLEDRGYRKLPEGIKFNAMPPGTYSFRLNIPVKSEGGTSTVNIPVDTAVMPLDARPGDLPLMIEAKSAGDFTNTNKRRKEEAQKVSQLRHTYKEGVRFILFLCGYFDSGYLGYEAAEGIDWVWEHRIDDLAQFGLGPTDPSTPVEGRRVRLQAELDAQKSPEERNKLGQFSTPTDLASDILRYARDLIPNEDPVRFLDPALGTGSFYAALLRLFANERIEAASGIEIDPHYGNPAKALWRDHPLDVRLEDFTALKPPGEGFNLVICNPPYVRHHHMDKAAKARLMAVTAASSGIQMPGLAGLYCYFLGLTHPWMAPDGVAGWLIPSEFMDVNYGVAIKRYLLNQVELIRIHRFNPNDLQFGDALVSSAVVWFRKRKPGRDHKVEFSYGGTLAQPKLSRVVPVAALQDAAKWTSIAENGVRTVSDGLRLSDFFDIKRGLATGDNSFFIMSRDEVAARNLPAEMFTPILPGPRYLETDVVEALPDGVPKIARQMLMLDCRLPEDEVKRRYPVLWAYLQTGKPKVSETYLCSRRTPWYAQENRPAAPFICTYMGRNLTKRDKPFRFILNRSKATAANVYLLLYPKPHLASALASDVQLASKIWEFLNSINSATLLGEGRVYGGGLYKLEPKELANVPADAIAAMLPTAERRPAKQPNLFSGKAA
jgi:adenine-specific DNA-methyltransferase